MPRFIDFKGAAILFSAFAGAVFCIWAESSGNFLFVLVSHIAYFIETMFHELGHCITGWLLGMPGVPMIFTVVGPQGAGGMTLVFGHYWMVQAAALAALAYLCYEFYRRASGWFWAALLLLIIITGVMLSGYRLLVVSYMGHGGTIIASGYLLFKAWLNVDVSSQSKRWLCAFVGFYMAMQNMYFSYNLIHDEATKELYASSELVNDFIVMTDYVGGWTVEGIARFNMLLGGAVIIGSFLASLHVFKSGRDYV